MDEAFFRGLSRVAREAIEAECRILSLPRNKAEHGFDPVTAADQAAEIALREAIEARFPDHGIHGEEFGVVRPDASTWWSIDPIDGTRAFICGLPSWAILVGLIDQGRHVAGMLDLPILDETLVACGGATTLNGRSIQTSGCTVLGEARLATTDPYLFNEAPEAAAFERIRSMVKLTRFGLDALAYARVATGDIDLVIESGLKPHDYDALVAVIRGAGGHIGNWRGGDDLSSGQIVAAASRALYDEAVAVLAA